MGGLILAIVVSFSDFLCGYYDQSAEYDGLILLRVIISLVGGFFLFLRERSEFRNIAIYGCVLLIYGAACYSMRIAAYYHDMPDDGFQAMVIISFKSLFYVVILSISLPISLLYRELVDRLRSSESR
jgi:hypothetical protein